jgi:broad specificity phosphatase PhoE
MVFDRAFLTNVEDVTELILIRHGEQVLPDPQQSVAADIFDPPLSERGSHQAFLVGLRFSTERVDAVYSSPLQRALETGHQVARHHRLEPIVRQDLREVEVFRDVPSDQNVTSWVGTDLLMGMRERFLRERSWDVYPYSESSFDFRKRVINAVEAIIATNHGKRVAITCHGGVINAYLSHIIGSPYDMFFRPGHTAVNIVYAASTGVRALQSINDMHHLRTEDGSFVSH